MGLGGVVAASGRRVLLAAVGAGAAVALAAFGMRFVTAPAWASLLFEPLSLLFLPGLAVSIAVSESHDLDAQVVVVSSAILYFVAFWLFLELRAWGRRRQRTRQLS